MRGASVARSIPHRRIAHALLDADIRVGYARLELTRAIDHLCEAVRERDDLARELATLLGSKAPAA